MGKIHYTKNKRQQMTRVSVLNFFDKSVNLFLFFMFSYTVLFLIVKDLPITMINQIIEGLIYKFNNSVIEVNALIFTVSGAYLVTNKNYKYRFLGFLSFSTANFFYSLISINNNMYPMLIQTAVFQYINIYGMYHILHKDAKIINWEPNFIIIEKIKIFLSKTKKTSFILLGVVFLYYMSFVSKTPMQDIFQSVAAILAIWGSFKVANFENKVKFVGFAMFLTSDILYFFIAVTKTLYPMALQTLILLGSSIKGLKNTNS